MILEFEAQLVCYLSANRVERTVRETIKYDSWNEMVAKIQERENETNSDRQILDAKKLHSGFQALESSMRQILKEAEEKTVKEREKWTGISPT